QTGYGLRTTDYGLRTARATRTSLTTLLPVLWAIAALWLMMLVEVVVAKGDIGRMNTVFKLGMQSWVLFAVSSAVALTWVWGLTAGRRTKKQKTRTAETQKPRNPPRGPHPGTPPREPTQNPTEGTPPRTP